MPKTSLLDEITQVELAAAVAAHRLSNTLMWALRQRLLSYAKVEPGRYSIAEGLPEITPPGNFSGFNQFEVHIQIDPEIPEIFANDQE